MVTGTHTNITSDELKTLIKKNKSEREASEKCPTCDARRARFEMMHRFENEITTFLRENSFVQMDSCILCVEKHVSRAMVYHDELLTASGSGTADGTASVSVIKNHLKILGHLGCAIEESSEFEDLNTLLIQTERNYRYQGICPDWNTIANRISDVKKTMEPIWFD